MEKVWLTFEDKLINWVDGETDFYDKMEVVKDKMRFPQVNDHVLEEWAKSLISSVVYDDNIDLEDTASDLVEDIFTQERNFYYRWRNGYDEEESHLMFDKWQKLRSFVCDGFPKLTFSLSGKVREYLQEIGEIEEEDTDTENSQENKEKAAFRLKYGECIYDIDAFFERLKTMSGREFVKTYYEKHFAKSAENFKQFFNNEIQAIVPERKGERGWNYEALIKYVGV